MNPQAEHNQTPEATPLITEPAPAVPPNNPPLKKTRNKSDYDLLINGVAQQAIVPKKTAKSVTDNVFNVLKKLIAEKGEITIQGFGVFYQATTTPRSHNFANKAGIQKGCTRKKVIKFKCAKVAKTIVATPQPEN